MTTPVRRYSHPRPLSSSVTISVTPVQLQEATMRLFGGPAAPRCQVAERDGVLVVFQSEEDVAFGSDGHRAPYPVGVLQGDSFTVTCAQLVSAALATRAYPTRRVMLRLVSDDADTSLLEVHQDGMGQHARGWGYVRPDGKIGGLFGAACDLHFEALLNAVRGAHPGDVFRVSCEGRSPLAFRIAPGFSPASELFTVVLGDEEAVLISRER